MLLDEETKRKLEINCEYYDEYCWRVHYQLLCEKYEQRL